MRVRRRRRRCSPKALADRLTRAGQRAVRRCRSHRRSRRPTEPSNLFPVGRNRAVSSRPRQARAKPAPFRPIRQSGSSRPRCCRSGRACACTPESVRQAGGLNVTVPRSRSGTVDTSAARSSGVRSLQESQTRGSGARRLSHCQRAALRVRFCNGRRPGMSTLGLAGLCRHRHRASAEGTPTARAFPTPRPRASGRRSARGEAAGRARGPAWTGGRSSARCGLHRSRRGG